MSVCLSVRRTAVLCRNGYTYPQTVWQYSYEDPLTGALNAGGMKKSRFLANILLYLGTDTRYRHSYYGIRIGNRTQALDWVVSLRMTLSDHGWLSEIFNDMKHRAVSLRQLRFLFCSVVVVRCLSASSCISLCGVTQGSTRTRVGEAVHQPCRRRPFQHFRAPYLGRSACSAETTTPALTMPTGCQ